MIIINFKNYVHRKDSLRLAKLIEKYLPRAVVAVSHVDLSCISANTKLSVYAQHVDSPSSPQKSTGFVTARAVKNSGATGSLINHSEHQISNGAIWSAVNDLDELKLKSIVCVPTLRVAKEVMKFKPFAIAFEDIELIATGKSITNYHTRDIEAFVEMLRGTRIIPLCGAGISSADDVRAAFDLGCNGVLISSAIAATTLGKAEKLLKEIRGLY